MHAWNGHDAWTATCDKFWHSVKSCDPEEFQCKEIVILQGLVMRKHQRIVVWGFSLACIAMRIQLEYFRVEKLLEQAISAVHCKGASPMCR